MKKQKVLKNRYNRILMHVSNKPNRYFREIYYKLEVFHRTPQVIKCANCDNFVDYRESQDYRDRVWLCSSCEPLREDDIPF